MSVPNVPAETTAKTHDPCCSSHGASLDCDTYRRTHFVEVGPCCDIWAKKDPYSGWVPRGCPAGFSSECSHWSSISPCRCLTATLPFNRAQDRAFEWRPMGSAPTDGTAVVGLIGDDEVEVRWAEQRVCMLAGEALGAGTFGPGWEDTANCLEVDAPEGWRPVEAGEPR